MISVVIPLFNRDVNALVWELSKQVSLLNQEAEIIVMDDGSDPSIRKLHLTLDSIPFVRYFISNQNNGRVRIRQMLAEKASFEWLLFLDCDSKIISNRFLENYFLQMSQRAPVVVGGRIYSAEMPADCSMHLHWKYGTIRERTSPGKAGNRFMTNNFLIRKNVFEKFVFESEWGSYGYEDTWMGIQLEDMKIPITHIDNPVMHEGVEDSSGFIAKTHQALQNLHLLSMMVSHKTVARHVRLYSYYYRMRSYRMLWIVDLAYYILKPLILKNLHSCNPSLLMFDLYRLRHFKSEVNL